MGNIVWCVYLIRVLVVGIEGEDLVVICYFDWIRVVKYIYDLLVLKRVSLIIFVFRYWILRFIVDFDVFFIGKSKWNNVIMV